MCLAIDFWQRRKEPVRWPTDDDLMVRTLKEDFARGDVPVENLEVALERQLNATRKERAALWRTYIGGLIDLQPLTPRERRIRRAEWGIQEKETDGTQR